MVVTLQSRKQILAELHSAHPGAPRMKSLALMFVWWPKLDESIELEVWHCSDCQWRRESGLARESQPQAPRRDSWQKTTCRPGRPRGSRRHQRGWTSGQRVVIVAIPVVRWVTFGVIVRREHQQGATPRLRNLRTDLKGKYAVTTAGDGGKWPCGLVLWRVPGKA